MEQMELSDILKGVDRPVVKSDVKTEIAPAPTEKVDVAPVTEASPPPVSARKAHRDREQAAQGRERNPETGQFSPKEAAPKETPPAETPAPPAKPAQPEMSEKERALLAAAIDERAKRQAIEKQLADLRSAAPAEPAKTFWDDPEAALAKVQGEMRGLAVKTRLDTSETIARGRYTDYDEKINIFKGLAETTPGLFERAVAAPDPADFAYQTAKRHKEIQEAGGVNELLAKKEKETRIKVEAEMREKFKKEQEEREKEQAAIPGSLSGVAGTGNTRPVWSGPTPLDSILKS